MIAIVDGGSTKCDWIILKKTGEEILQTKTRGFNPNNINANQIPSEINKNKEIAEIKKQIRYVYFYGSGCGTQENKNIVQAQLLKVFPTAHIRVEEDLVAAAYAVYRDRPTMVCILGTGSNSCFFDGKKVKVKLPSLGFMLGDDGSGSALGKRLVKNFFMAKLPKEIEEDFINEYHLTIEETLENMYHKKDMVNAFFAKFNEFVFKWKEHSFIQNMIYDEFSNYVEYQLLPYEEVKGAEISFIGSVAYVYSEILKSVLSEYNLNFGIIVRRPISNLVQYHRKYIFPQLED